MKTGSPEESLFSFPGFDYFQKSAYNIHKRI